MIVCSHDEKELNKRGAVALNSRYRGKFGWAIVKEPEATE
jgi:hypothetical protein